jgi:kynurenine formamidase
MGEHRAVFDFHISFTNGGGLEGKGFRLDVPSPSVTEEEVGWLLVRSLGLLMTGAVKLEGMTIVEEPHRGSRGAEMPRAAVRGLVELSHSLVHGMTTYPGLPPPEMSDHLTREASEALYADGVQFQIGRLTLVGNTGTYVDSPFHRFADGVDLAGLPLSRLADLDGVLVRVQGSTRRAVDVGEFAPYDIAGRAVLVHTGWDRHWRQPAYGTDAPFLTRAAADWLVARGAVLVGIDSVNIDDIGDRSRPVHSALLGAGIPIVEHLAGLNQLPITGFRFHAAPPMIERFGTFPVRAYAVVP